MESLDGLIKAKVGHFILKDWAISALHEKIEYKAKDAGIRVDFVEPAYTSQRCAECGHIGRANRPDRDHFLCEACGHADHADRNAARNLATDGIADIIARGVAEREKAGDPSQTEQGIDF